MSDTENDGNKKASFIQRMLAFFIDILIIAFISSLIASPFINDKKLEELNEKSVQLIEKYNKAAINTNEYVAEYVNVSYDLAKNSGIVTIVKILLGLIYFVIIPLYNNGQTFGKKILKIKIISLNKSLNANQLVFRAFIANSILYDIISIVFIMFAARNIYFYCNSLFTMLQYLITVISIFMILYTKDGLSVHDRLVYTKVVKC